MVCRKRVVQSGRNYAARFAERRSFDVTKSFVAQIGRASGRRQRRAGLCALCPKGSRAQGWASS
eukprot:4975693-Lingulodinium_polyedra.AAC.1